MASNRRRARRLAVWRAYQHRIDRLAGNRRRRFGTHPMRVTLGYFRAEGWDTKSRSCWRSFRGA